MTRFDPATRARLRLLYPDIKVRAIRLYNDMAMQFLAPVRCTEAVRTWDYQAKLYMQGRSLPGPIVTYSKPGMSLHHYGCALDSCFLGKDPFAEKDPTLWDTYGRLAKAHGFEWGGSWSKFVDRPHIQLTYGLTLAEIRELYQAGGNAAVWAKFDQIRKVPQGQGWDSEYTRTKLLELGEMPDLP